MTSSASVPDSVATAARADTLRFLLEHGADTIDHPGGKLFDHLLRTAVTLAEWGAPDELVAAGLSHAVYGTDGFPVALTSVEGRAQVTALLGAPAEAIVYTYCASERAVTWKAPVDGGPVPYRDRFTGETRTLNAAEASEYWTLTAANELDLVDRFPGLAEHVLGPLEHNVAFLPEPGRQAVADARVRHPR